MSYCQTLSDSFVPPKAQEAPASLRWYGEVWNCLLSGEVEIRFPCGDKVAVPVPRIVHLDDGLDPEAGMGPMVGEDGMILEEEEDDAVSTDRSWETEDDADDGASVDEGEMSLDQDGVVSLVQGTFGEGEDDPEDSDFVMKDADGKPVKADEEDRREGDRRQSKRRRGHGPSTAQDEVKGWADEVAEPSIAAPSTSEAAATADATTAAATVQDAPAVAAAADDSVNAPTAVVSMPTETSDFADWSRFGVLEEAPEDHHYYSERVLAPSKAFMSRIRKEHQVLATSLPRELSPTRFLRYRQGSLTRRPQQTSSSAPTRIGATSCVASPSDLSTRRSRMRPSCSTCTSRRKSSRTTLPRSTFIRGRPVRASVRTSTSKAKSA